MALQCETLNSQSSQIKLSPQDSINEFIIRKLNPLVVVDLRSVRVIRNSEFPPHEVVIKFLPGQFP